jgi:hypothetical protein
MNKQLSMHDVIALLEELLAKDFNTAGPLLLHRGQIGTVVMTYPDGACDGVRRPRQPGIYNFTHPT